MAVVVNWQMGRGGGVNGGRKEGGKPGRGGGGKRLTGGTV